LETNTHKHTCRFCVGAAGQAFGDEEDESESESVDSEEEGESQQPLVENADSDGHDTSGQNAVEMREDNATACTPHGGMRSDLAALDDRVPHADAESAGMTDDDAHAGGDVHMSESAGGHDGHAASARALHNDSRHEGRGMHNHTRRAHAQLHHAHAAQSHAHEHHARAVKQHVMPENEELLCAQILARLLKRRDGERFAQAPNASHLQTLHGIDTVHVPFLRRPQDLGTIHKKLRDGAYSGLPDFAEDVRLVFSNVMTFHESNSKDYKAASRMRRILSDMCKELGVRNVRCAGEWPYDYRLLLKRLMQNKDATAFLQPVNPEEDECPDYLSVISSPMDLPQVLQRLDDANYSSPEDMATDVRRTFLNAMQYNPAKHPVHAAARRMLKIFEERFAKLQRPAEASAHNDTDKQHIPVRKPASWCCPHHRCAVTQRPASDCGGLLFRCCSCPRAFSDDCLEDGFEPVCMDAAYSRIGYVPPTSAEYIRCAVCVRKMPNETLQPDVMEPCEVDDEGDEEQRDQESQENVATEAMATTPAKDEATHADSPLSKRKRASLKEVRREDAMEDADASDAHVAADLSSQEDDVDHDARRRASRPSRSAQNSKGQGILAGEDTPRPRRAVNSAKMLAQINGEVDSESGDVSGKEMCLHICLPDVSVCQRDFDDHACGPVFPTMIPILYILAHT
jgi:hypothetical protein